MESAVCEFEGVRLKITAGETAISRVEFAFDDEITGDVPQNGLLAECVGELREYFAENRRDFDLPLEPKGTKFQKSVWDALRKIPYGETKTYKEIAESIGNEKASRAVGMACRSNPIVILIPCHRVIGADGKLTGFAGGIDVKLRLLGLEAGDKSRFG